MKTDQDGAARAVACPLCKAKPGRPCRDTRTRFPFGATVHRERVDPLPTEPPPTPPLPDGTPSQRAPDTAAHACMCGQPIEAHDSLARCPRDPDPATTAFDHWYAGQLAESTTRPSPFDCWEAGRADERRRIREGSHRMPGERWYDVPADLLAGDGDA